MPREPRWARDGPSSVGRIRSGPWNDDGAREPDEVGPDGRGKTSWLLLGRLPEVTRRKGGTGIQVTTSAASSLSSE
jgi:hypothetical protein